jgi:hypothetical protein
VVAILPVSPGQVLRVGVGARGDDPGRQGYPNGGSTTGGKSTLYEAGFGGGASAVTTESQEACLGYTAAQRADRSQILVMAGGGGGGGGGNTFGSGGNGGNAGANDNFSGEAGKDAYRLTSADCNGGGGGVAARRRPPVAQALDT